MLDLTPAVWFAVTGAFAIKLLELAESYNLPKPKRPDFRDWLYWASFLIMPLLGGAIAHAYVSSSTNLTPILAINVGVSAPLILRTMAQVNPLRPTEEKTPPGA